MKRTNDPIVSVQIHPKILEHIDCYSRDQYSTRSETIRKVLHQWCRDSRSHVEEPPVFQY
jgi:metal-responsive CopG/Arc/MetJ family transcriptional regulator